MIEKACPELSLTNPSTLVAISGSGNVAQFTALKVIELGGTVLTLSDSKGTLIASTEKGYTKEFVEKIGQLKLKGGSLEELKGESDYEYVAGERPWTLVKKIHIALPGATQNEMSGEEAEALIGAGVRIVAEGSNMVGFAIIYSLLDDSEKVWNRDVRSKQSRSSRLQERKEAPMLSGMLQEVRDDKMCLNVMTTDLRFAFAFLRSLKLRRCRCIWS
jgi:hypothetical protein